MKKATILVVLVLVLAFMLSACGNKDMFDTVYTFRYGIIKLPNGEIVEGKVERWSDYEGDQLQITIDGETYLVHSVNATLMVNGK